MFILIIWQVGLHSIIMSAASTPNKDHSSKESQKDVESSEEYNFPKSLKEFGFYFSEEGQLLEIKTNKKFKFSISDDKKYNQKRYEALGNIMTDHIYEILKSRCKLEEIFLPDSMSGRTMARSRIFLSPGALTDKEVLLVLIQGSGVVRSGVWSRRLLINEGLNAGSQIPLIEEAQNRGWGVIILNPNLNFQYLPADLSNPSTCGGKKIYVKEHSSPEQHVENVWRNFIRTSAAKWILMIGHSYGGIAITHQLQLFSPEAATHRVLGRSEWNRRRMEYINDLLTRVAGIVLTDSPASFALQGITKPQKLLHWFQQNSVNYVSSDLPLDTLISEPQLAGIKDIPRRSAGTTEHERTATLPLKEMLQHLESRLNAVKGSESLSPEQNEATATTRRKRSASEEL